MYKDKAKDPSWEEVGEKKEAASNPKMCQMGRLEMLFCTSLYTYFDL